MQLNKHEIETNQEFDICISERVQMVSFIGKTRGICSQLLVLLFSKNTPRTRNLELSILETFVRLQMWSASRNLCDNKSLKHI